jgi:hypothetical protein
MELPFVQLLQWDSPSVVRDLEIFLVFKVSFEALKQRARDYKKILETQPFNASAEVAEFVLRPVSHEVIIPIYMVGHGGVLEEDPLRGNS